MLISEALALLLASVAVALWWMRSPRRKSALWLLGGALASAAYALWHGRWQMWPALLAAPLLAAPFLLRDRRWQRVLGRLLGATGATALMASALALWLCPLFALPSPDGPYAVGTRHFELTDRSRLGVMEDPPQAARRIVVWAWYPATAGGERPRNYFTGDERELARSVARNWGMYGFAFDHLRQVPTHSRPDAPLSTAQSRWPVVVFNHGYWGWPGQNTALMERLASHGYLVFSIGHPYDAGAYTFADGTRIPTSPAKAAATVPTAGMLAFWKAHSHDAHYAAMARYHHDFDHHRVMRSFNAWRADIGFLVDTLQQRRLPAAVAALGDAADLSRLAFAGMSFGGTTSASACHHDRRCVAAVNMDGEEFDWSLWDADIRVPLLLLHSDFERYPLFGAGTGVPHSTIMDYAYERWDRIGERADVVRVRVVGERHLGLTDLPLSARMPVRGRIYGEQDGETGVAATNDLVLAFLDHALKGQDNGYPGRVFARQSALRPHDASSVRRWWQARAGAQPR
ncbi:hypothetical protein FZ025_10645 [Xanthomonas hyacinthi]|uniref:Dienelactone hydrolase n=1 Tax=Xanthomonas hyacinthi TaxID=56455 RepID=A0A2S7EXH9_9XANT|nr:hypothetical protein [Xanthomonas hyacinthi]PPU97733.1 hypothetical protein XhyaCFBP1156_10315 [Xanthomonas hyacinthi]QGY77074.1 hypothetical protein FZ025_10645 [Xanthomonas hyacinthi]